MNIDALYQRVTEAILRAEALETNAPAVEAAQAYLTVSFVEEEIAEALPASEEEGAIARRGGVPGSCCEETYHRRSNHRADVAFTHAARTRDRIARPACRCSNALSMVSKRPKRRPRLVRSHVTIGAKSRGNTTRFRNVWRSVAIVDVAP